MSESTTGTNAIEQVAGLLKGDQPAEANAEKVETQGEPAETDEALGEGGKKALKAEREARTNAERQAAELKEKLDKIEAANMSDLERAQKAAREAEEAAAKAPIAAFREAAVIFGGINADDADLFLTASDTDTLKKQAARLIERTSTPTTPKPDPTQGAQQAPALNGDELTNALARAVGAR